MCECVNVSMKDGTRWKDGNLKGVFNLPFSFVVDWLPKVLDR